LRQIVPDRPGDGSDDGVAALLEPFYDALPAGRVRERTGHEQIVGLVSVCWGCWEAIVTENLLQ
jgi:hypothetical protein